MRILRRIEGGKGQSCKEHHIEYRLSSVVGDGQSFHVSKSVPLNPSPAHRYLRRLVEVFVDRSGGMWVLQSAEWNNGLESTPIKAWRILNEFHLARWRGTEGQARRHPAPRAIRLRCCILAPPSGKLLACRAPT